MLQTRIPNPREIESREPESASLQHALSYALALFGRQYPQMILTLVLCISVAGVYLLTAQKRYTGTAVVLIDSRKMQGLQTQASLGAENPIDSAMVDSQVEILKSEAIASAVIKDLRLLDTAEFTGNEGGLLGRMAKFFWGMSPESRPSDFQALRT